MAVCVGVLLAMAWSGRGDSSVAAVQAPSEVSPSSGSSVAPLPVDGGQPVAELSDDDLGGDGVAVGVVVDEARVTEMVASRWAGSATPTAMSPEVASGEVLAVPAYGRYAPIYVDASIAADVDALIKAAAADGIEMGGWGHRSNEDQIRLRREHCGMSHYAIYEMPSSQCTPPTARPGTSQHEKGLAIDFTIWRANEGKWGAIPSRNTAAWQWLWQHAAEYGLFPFKKEPWHWSTTGR
ncbi:MAG: M15 family metallopeptidase [Actinomycetota bacterium]